MVKWVLTMLLLGGVSLSGPSFAAFVGPVCVPLPGPAGEGPSVGKEGKLIFSDPTKRIITIFTPSGEIVGSVSPPSGIPEHAIWPEATVVTPVADTVIAKGGGVVSVLDHSGNTVTSIENPAGGELYALSDCFVVYDLATDQYLRYSGHGELIGRSAEIPTDIGIYLGSESGSAAACLHTVTYPDRTYRFSIPHEKIKSYRRDIRGNLYITAARTGGTTVYKINSCGKVSATLAIPEDMASVEGSNPATYGEPSFDSEGTVYVSRFGLTSSVLKWTSVDDPVEVCQ